MKPFSKLLKAYSLADHQCNEHVRGRSDLGMYKEREAAAASIDRFFDVQRLLCMGWDAAPGDYYGEDGWLWTHREDRSAFSAGSHDDVPTIPPELVEMLK